jgi:hypothetical protein
MNGKKAKAIRRMAKEAGHFKTEPDLRVKETKKMAYGLDSNGKRTVQEVTRQTLINMNRIIYRRMKKAYKNGELAV